MTEKNLDVRHFLGAARRLKKQKSSDRSEINIFDVIIGSYHDSQVSH